MQMVQIVLNWYSGAYQILSEAQLEVQLSNSTWDVFSKS